QGCAGARRMKTPRKSNSDTFTAVGAEWKMLAVPRGKPKPINIPDGAAYFACYLAVSEAWRAGRRANEYPHVDVEFVVKHPTLQFRDIRRTFTKQFAPGDADHGYHNLVPLAALAE